MVRQDTIIDNLLPNSIVNKVINAYKAGYAEYLC